MIKNISTQRLNSICGGIDHAQVEQIESFHKGITSLMKKNNRSCNITKYLTDHKACTPEEYDFALLGWSYVYEKLVNFPNSNHAKTAKK